MLLVRHREEQQTFIAAIVTIFINDRIIITASLCTTMRRLTNLERYFLLGCFGWCVEIVFTAVMDSWVFIVDDTRSSSSSQNAWKLKGVTYLWMHPIYGGGLHLGTMILPMARNQLSLPLRLLVGVVVCFGVEYVSGYLLRAITGICPWDYTQAKWNMHGLIRLDYAPAWTVLSYLVEWLTDMLDSIRVVPMTRPRIDRTR